MTARGLRWVIVVAVLFAGLPGAAQDPGPTATTEVDDVRGVPLASGGASMLTYRVTHSFLDDTDRGTPLPGTRIPRTEAFDGLWGDAGYLGAWLSPTGRFQFSPHSSLLEDAYFRNTLYSGGGAEPLGGGDRFDLAMANLSWDAPLPTDSPRGQPLGTLEWDDAADHRVVHATFGEQTAELDVLFVRADVTARGGDVDARRSAQAMPPLVIDLPRVYPGQVRVAGVYGVTFPYTAYIQDFGLEILPGTGKAVLNAVVRGYLPEAGEERLPNGADLKPWHLPIHAIIVVSPDDDLLEPRAALGMVDGGIGHVTDGHTTDRVEVPAGAALHAGPAGMASLSGGLAGEPAVDAMPSAQLDEFRAAGAVTRDLDAPIDLVQGGGHYGLTLDPDFRGEGVLALHARRGPTGTPFVDVAAVPWVVVDGEPVRLDRGRLVGLRVFPQVGGLGVTVTSGGAETPMGRVRRHGVPILFPGVVVHAAYDLGAQRYAFVTLGGPSATATPRLNAAVSVRSFDNEPFQARVVYHLELPAGEVVYAGQPRTTEFSAPLDTRGEHGSLIVGPRLVTATAGQIGFDGQVSVLRAPAPLSPAPAADPATALGDGPVALVYQAPADVPPAVVRDSSMRIDLTADGEPPVAEPPPLGQPCGQPQAQDAGLPDAPPGLDVAEAWFDADDANLYATIRVRGAPQPPPDGAAYRWSLSWRYDHSGLAARAGLDAYGEWTFEVGGYSPDFFPQFFVGPSVPGEADGELIRIWIPRDVVRYLDGELLRDTGAHSWIEAAGVPVQVDRAPVDADPAYGTGGDYTVGACG